MGSGPLGRVRKAAPNATTLGLPVCRFLRVKALCTRLGRSMAASSNCEDEAWEAEDDGRGERETARVVSKIYNEGYRVGRGAEEERELQCGFDAGFCHAMKFSRVLGKFYGTLRLLAKTEQVGDVRLVEIVIFERIPEGGRVLREHFDDLQRASRAILVGSTSDEESTVSLLLAEIESHVV